MREKNIKKVFLVSMCLLLVAGWMNTLFTKVGRVKSVRKLYKKINHREMAVAMFYREDREVRRTPSSYAQVTRLKDIFSSLEESVQFKEAEIRFVSINVAKRSDLEVLADDIGVHSLPAFVLFKYGEPVKDNNMTQQLNGFASRAQIKQFINKHFRERIEEIIEERAKIRKRRAEEAYYHRPYFGWGLGYGYPYHYWGPYYRGYYGYGYP